MSTDERGRTARARPPPLAVTAWAVGAFLTKPEVGLPRDLPGLGKVTGGGLPPFRSARTRRVSESR